VSECLVDLGYPNLLMEEVIPDRKDGRASGVQPLQPFHVEHYFAGIAVNLKPLLQLPAPTVKAAV
jgi:hypothetical protein